MPVVFNESELAEAVHETAIPACERILILTPRKFTGQSWSPCTASLGEMTRLAACTQIGLVIFLLCTS